MDKTTDELFELAKELAARPYPFQMFKEPESDREIMFLASNPDLDGCMAQGASQQEAIENLADARIDYIYFLLKREKSVPGPSEITPSYSNSPDQFTVTMSFSSGGHTRNSKMQEELIEKEEKHELLYEASLKTWEAHQSDDPINNFSITYD